MAAGDEEKAVWGAAHYRVLFILYLSYFANVFGRTAVQVSFPVLQAGFGLTHTMTASLLSAGAISQVFGKLINASIIAKLGSSASFVLNLGLQIISYAIMTVPLGGAFSYPRFMVGWVLQMWGASSMWPMMTSLCSDAFQGNGFGRALGILATSSRAGAIFGNMIFGPLSARVSWQRLIHLSMITAGVALVAFKACLFPLPAPPAAAAAATAAAPEPAKDAGAKAVVPYSEAIKAFVTSPRVFLVFFCQTMMTMGMECQALLPLYLQQGAGLTAAAAGSMAAVFPLGAAAATLATGAVFDKMRGVKRLALFGAENFIAIGALGMLAGSPATPSAAVLVAIMVGVAPTFYIPSADFVTRFAGPDYKGTLMSYMDIPGQLANIGFMSIYPMLLERGGWGLVFRALQVTILAGAGAMATFLLMDAKSPTRVFSDGRKEKAVAPKPAADDEAFSGVTAVPPDPVFFVSQQYKECTAKIKMNLGVGAYRTNEGKPLVLDVVKKAEQAVTAKLVDNSFNVEYLPIDGLPEFRKETTKLILGKDSKAIAEGRVACCQSLSGTGALRLAAEFIAVNLGKDRRVFVSDPTWGNHHAIFAKAGLEVVKYSYFQAETKGLDFSGMMADLEAVKAGDIVLLHGCAHNPTGVDPTMEQWSKIAALVKAKSAIPFFDCAYQGYASGDLDEDAASVRYFESQGIEMMIAQSYSKNFGLYGERIGALSVTTNDGPEVAQAVQSQLKMIVRPMYSNPPSNGARIVAHVLSTPELYADWVAELKSMSGRIIEMRDRLRSGLEKLKPENDWSFITTQIGMFAYTGLTAEQVGRLGSEFNIFMLKSGRISMAGVSSNTVDYLAESIAKVL